MSFKKIKLERKVCTHLQLYESIFQKTHCFTKNFVCLEVPVYMDAEINWLTKEL